MQFTVSTTRPHVVSLVEAACDRGELGDEERSAILTALTDESKILAGRYAVILDEKGDVLDDMPTAMARAQTALPVCRCPVDLVLKGGGEPAGLEYGSFPLEFDRVAFDAFGLPMMEEVPLEDGSGETYKNVLIIDITEA